MKPVLVKSAGVPMTLCWLGSVDSSRSSSVRTLGPAAAATKPLGDDASGYQHTNKPTTVTGCTQLFVANPPKSIT